MFTVHKCWLFYLPSNDMLDSFCFIPKCLTTHISYHRFVVDGTPHALIAKTESNQLERQEGNTFKVLHSCLMSRYSWEGQCLRLNPWCMLASGDTMCRETYFCNMWSTDLVWRQKISVDGYCSANDNAKIRRALFVV